MKKSMFLLIVMVLTISQVYAQGSRKYVKDAISSWGTCRNVAITDTGGDIALNYSNQYAYSGIPSDLSSAIKSLHDKGELIDDIQLTEEGRWLILIGNNGIQWNDIPYSLESKLRELNSNREVITSVTFNDYGDWIVITTEHISASTDKIYDWIKAGMYDYGQLWAAHITNDGLALCYAEGYKFMGNVPYKMKEALKNTRNDIYRIKFTPQGSYFFADIDGRYSYYM